MRKILWDILENQSSRYFYIVNDFFAVLTLISVVAVAMETVESFPYRGFLVGVEYFAVFFFSIEYIGRILARKNPLAYVFSFFGIIDLIAILPTYLGLGNFSFLKSVRVVRLLRLLRMIRLAKVLRVHSTDSLREDGFIRMNIYIYITALIGAALMSASAIWFVEGQRLVFESIPHAMLWSIKVLLGGTPQAHVETISGEVIVIATRFVGLILFGLLINIVGDSVRKLLLGGDK